MEPVSSPKTTIVSPVATQNAHDRHTTRRVLIGGIVLGSISILIGGIFIIRAYINHREEKFQQWYEQQRLTEMNEAVNVINAEKLPVPTYEQMKTMVSSTSQQVEGLTLEEARLLGKQHAVDREAEARDVYKKSN